MASITEHTWITAKCHDPQDDAMVLCQITGKNEKQKQKSHLMFTKSIMASI